MQHVDGCNITRAGDESHSYGRRGQQWTSLVATMGRVRLLSCFCPAIRNEVRTAFRPTPLHAPLPSIIVPPPCQFKRGFGAVS